MAYTVAYLVRTYSIPSQLLVNSNQTWIHLVPNVEERTWEPKGEKHVQVLSIEDKHQITMVVTSNAVGDLLPPQVIFTRTTKQTLPLKVKERRDVLQMVSILLILKTIGQISK